MVTLLTIESTPANLPNERRLTSAINRVEVLGRTGKLPVAYAEAAANHMYGMLNVKFRPLWDAAVRAIVALASAQEVPVWPCLEAQLRYVTNPIRDGISDGERSDTATTHPNDENNDASTIHNHLIQHLDLCVAWEKSGGANASIFGDKAVAAARIDGRVSRYQCTDANTIFELVWSVMEGVPQLTTRKSRVVVPIFLTFLHRQYYLFHDDDPDSREFGLKDHVDASDDDER